MEICFSKAFLHKELETKSWYLCCIFVSFKLLDDKVTLLLPGKTLPSWKLYYHKAADFASKYRLPLTIGGGAVTIVVAFGLSNTFFFILRSAGM
jgi:hypothetical protein